MDISQAAAALHCSERWLTDNLRAGRFPAKKIGRKWVLSDDDITAILQLCSVMPVATTPDPVPHIESSTSMTQTTLRRLQQGKQRR
jgi:Helix-turn-helix domain